MFRKVLVANRGEIAGRVMRTLRRMGIASVAVYADPDRFAPPVLAADESVRIGPAPASESYLSIDAVLDACRRTGAEAVHPGYGFLSERPAFAERLEAAGVRFIGPRAEHMLSFGLKHTAREIAARSGVRLAPGSGLLDDSAAALAAAAAIGYPVMLKSTAGGGGIGMQVCADADALAARFDTVQRQGRASFGDARVYLEKFVARARHVEVQIFGDGRGGVVALGERDCSLQRRHQKVIEETPAPGLSETTRRALHEAAIALGRAVDYESAGTVEFIYDAETEAFYFLEVNTRLQVEHCVTEEAFGIDLVEWMVRQAAGAFELPPQETLRPRGAVIEARVYAENPAQGFRPSTGRLTEVRFDGAARVDGWVETGTEVSSYYDPLLAKIIVAGADRGGAIDGLRAALGGSAIYGIETNLDYLRFILDLPAFRRGEMTTGTLGAIDYRGSGIEVLAAGTQTSVQDWPGRLGYWDIGVPPSGPMDDRSFRLANCIVGNPEGAAGIECTVSGPTLRFESDTVIALAGAAMRASLDGEAVPYWQAVPVRAGQVLTLGAVEGPGNRTYLAVRHGIDAPLFLGARATFALGGFGGHATGLLRPGDTLRIARQGAVGEPLPVLPESQRPPLTRRWEIGVLYGPHGAPDFFQDADIADLFASPFEVHYNSARTGVRLIGPKPRWARPDGGEAGLHPSNIHDNAYAIGAIDYTGDMPIILGPDGPSLGGFVCPAVVARGELWKTGQLRPGDEVRFRRLPAPQLGAGSGDEAVLGGREGPIPVRYRRAGDACLLIEYGPLVLDIRLRLRVQLLLDALRRARLPGIIDLTPGIRSLQVHYDPVAIGLPRLLDTLARLETELPAEDEAEIPGRILHLPLSWNDEQAELAMRRYQELVRPDAPWCPSNIEFIRRINGLGSIEDVRRIVFDASYLVLGLGDVYLGAPVATPLDPRHRLVTTKYNPARPWTPENAVGIGGAYLCIYGMEGPGGYQLFGRTVQVWNSWRRTEVFQSHALLRFFDQIRFFPVSHAELLEARAALPHGRYPIRIEETRFSAPAYDAFLAANAPGIAAFQATREAAFEAERQRWAEQGLDAFVAETGIPDPLAEAALPDGCVGVDSPVPGSVWKILVKPGDTVAPGDVVAIIESMKTEMRVTAPAGGRVREVFCKPGREVRGGQRIAVLRTGGGA